MDKQLVIMTSLLPLLISTRLVSAEVTPEAMPQAKTTPNHVQTNMLAAEHQNLQNVQPVKPTSPINIHPEHPILKSYFSESSVTTSPYLGLRSAWDGSDLIVNLPSINEDFRLLQHRSQLTSKLHPQARSFDQHPLLEISGSLAGLISWSKPNQQTSTTDIDLGTAKLDMLGELSSKILAFMSFTYDSSDKSSSGARVGYSRLFLKRGFIVVGDTKTYATIGQMFLPFGHYSSSMISSPLTSDLAQTNARALLIGGAYKNLHGATYLFNGETKTSGSGINNWGAELDYHETYRPFQTKLQTKVGISYISTLADSSGMQSTGGSDFAGFDHIDGTTNYQYLQHQVPGINGFLHIQHGSCTLKGEYLTATRSFAYENLSFSEHGAKPAALQAEISYRFLGFKNPLSASIAYNQSWQALGLNLPRQSWSIGLSHSYFKNSIASFEFRHTNDYKLSDTASGQGNLVNSTGHHSNTITIQFKVYF